MSSHLSIWKPVRPLPLTIFLLLSAPLWAQTAARQALATFPADSQQIAYIGLAQLRTMREYPQFGQQLFLRQLLEFQDFLRLAGMNPEKEIDDLVLGWRGELLGGGGFFGLAEGRFDTDRLRRFFVQQQLPIREYSGCELYAFGTGGNLPYIYFAFLSSSTAVFGRRHDLRALLDVQEGVRPPLETNPTFTNWMAELEGTSPQWGVSIGRAAINHAAPWLAAGARLVLDPYAFAGSVRAVLYRIDWGSVSTTHVSVVCASPESASALSALLNLWRDSNVESTFNRFPPSIATMLASMEIESDGDRIVLISSAPLEVIGQMIGGTAR